MRGKKKTRGAIIESKGKNEEGEVEGEGGESHKGVRVVMVCSRLKS